MADWFWYFMIYSLIGFFVEVVFAWVTHGSKRDRKCRYFLPICPVYGLGAVALLLLPPAVKTNPLLLFPVAAILCSAVEYFTGLFYERVARVSFWDYSHLPLNVGGKVCLLFSLFWGVLALALFYIVQPFVFRLVVEIPIFITVPALLFVLLDTGFTLFVLRRAQSTDALRWYAHLGHRQSRTA